MLHCCLNVNVCHQSAMDKGIVCQHNIHKHCANRLNLETRETQCVPPLHHFLAPFHPLEYFYWLRQHRSYWWVPQQASATKRHEALSRQTADKLPKQESWKILDLTWMVFVILKEDSDVGLLLSRSLSRASTSLLGPPPCCNATPTFIFNPWGEGLTLRKALFTLLLLLWTCWFTSGGSSVLVLCSRFNPCCFLREFIVCLASCMVFPALLPLTWKRGSFWPSFSLASFTWNTAIIRKKVIHCNEKHVSAFPSRHPAMKVFNIKVERIKMLRISIHHYLTRTSVVIEKCNINWFN